MLEIKPYFSQGQKARAIRENVGMSLKQLSEKSGVPENKIERFENDQYKLTYDEAVAISEALGVRLEFLSSLPKTYLVFLDTELRELVQKAQEKYSHLNPQEVVKMLLAFYFLGSDEKIEINHEEMDQLYLLRVRFDPNYSNEERKLFKSFIEVTQENSKKIKELVRRILKHYLLNEPIDLNDLKIDKEALEQLFWYRTKWGKAVNCFLSWVYDNRYRVKSFDRFAEFIFIEKDGELDMEQWTFFKGYDENYERFAKDWIVEEERESYLQYAQKYEE